MGKVQGQWGLLEQMLREERRRKEDCLLIIDCGEVVPADALTGYEGKGAIFAMGAPGKRGNFELITGNGVLNLPSTHLEVAYYLDESQPLSISSVPDLLISKDWPLGYHKGINPCPALPSETCLSASVASVADKLSPRYHFAVAAEQFYERPAYQSAQGWASYFVGLGKVSAEAEWNTWAYELEIEGIEGMNKRELMQLPNILTENPYSPIQPLEELIVKHFPKEITEKQLYRFFSSYANIKEVRIVKGRHAFARLTLPQSESQALIQATNGIDLDGRHISIGKSTSEPSKPQLKRPMSSCWFCLASTKCDERLIVEIYKHWYVAVPKGQITDQHVVLVPIAHVSGRGECGIEAREEMAEVMEKIRGKLGDYLAFEYGKREEERGIYHLYINIVPLESEQIEWLQTRFQSPLTISSYELQPNSQLTLLSPVYTLLSLHTASVPLYQVLSEVPSFKSDPARALVCVLISKPDLGDWRQCEDSAAETVNTARLRHLLAITTSK